MLQRTEWSNYRKNLHDTGTVIYGNVDISALRYGCNYPDSKVHGTNMGPTWGRQDPDGPHGGPMNRIIWVWTCCAQYYLHFKFQCSRSIHIYVSCDTNVLQENSVVTVWEFTISSYTLEFGVLFRWERTNFGSTNRLYVLGISFWWILLRFL